MLSVYWVTSTNCEVEIGLDGKKCRILLVADIESEVLKEDDKAIANNRESVTEYNAICLCGGILPSEAVLNNGHSRILASEPIARLFGLSELKLENNIERCQIQERIEIEESVIVSPYYSGGTLGACDWLILIKGKPFLLFCGSKSKGCNSSYSPPPCKHIIFAREANDSTNNTVTSPSPRNLIVPIKQESIVHYLLQLWSIPGSSFDCLPYWCHEAKQLCEKYEPVWGKVQLTPPCNLEQKEITFILENELGLIENYMPKNCIIDSNYLRYRQEFAWDVVDFSSIVDKLRGSGAVILGPRWLPYATILPKPHRVAYKMDIQETFILEGEETADIIFDSVSKEFNSSSFTVSIRGLKMEICTEKTPKASIDTLGKAHFKVNGENSQLNQRIVQVLQRLKNNEKQMIVPRGINTKIRQRPLSGLPQKRVLPTEVVESNVVNNKRNKIEENGESPKASLSAALITGRPSSPLQQETSLLKVPKSTNLASESPVDLKLQNLLTALRDEATGKLTLSDVAKLGKFGDKVQVMELIRKHPNVFRVQIIDGKRIIELI